AVSHWPRGISRVGSMSDPCWDTRSVSYVTGEGSAAASKVYRDLRPCGPEWTGWGRPPAGLRPSPRGRGWTVAPLDRSRRLLQSVCNHAGGRPRGPPGAGGGGRGGGRGRLGPAPRGGGAGPYRDPAAAQGRGNPRPSGALAR